MFKKPPPAPAEMKEKIEYLLRTKKQRADDYQMKSQIIFSKQNDAVEEMS